VLTKLVILYKGDVVMSKYEYDFRVLDDLLNGLRKIFKEELGYRLNTVEVERYVSSMREYIIDNGFDSNWREKSDELIDYYKSLKI
jgi:hypothetical protein